MIAIYDDMSRVCVDIVHTPLYTPGMALALAQPTPAPINIRVRAEERALIDQAAALLGKTRSEFMLEAARRAATDAILDRSLFRADAEAFARFQALLDAPAQPDARLRRLMATPAPWA